MGFTARRGGRGSERGTVTQRRLFFPRSLVSIPWRAEATDVQESCHRGLYAYRFVGSDRVLPKTQDRSGPAWEHLL